MILEGGAGAVVVLLVGGRKGARGKGRWWVFADQSVPQVVFIGSNIQRTWENLCDDVEGILR